MVIDAHVHAGFVKKGEISSGELKFRQEVMGLYKTDQIEIGMWRKMMEFGGIDRVFLLPLDVTASRGGCVGTNEEVWELMQDHPDMFIGFASVDPARTDVMDVLEKAFCEQGLYGLYLHPALQNFRPSDEIMEPIYMFCEEHNKPVIFHTGVAMEPGTRLSQGHPLEYEEVAARHPKLRICLSQFGWPWVREVCALMLKYRNIYTDTAMLYFDNPKEFYAQALGTDIGPKWIDRSLRHQVMFGSSEPRLEQLRMLRAVREMDMRESTREMILGKNALDFLNGGV